MAAPASVTIKTLDGKWVIDKTHSDSFDPVLALQGVGWLLRKGLSLATVTQALKSWSASPEDSPSSSPVTHIQIDQSGTGGVKGTTELRILDWQYRAHEDWLFGAVKGRSRWNTLKGLKEEYVGKGKGVIEEDVLFLIKEGEWGQDTVDGEVVESYVENEEKGWTAWQIWGFTEVGGKRRLIRRFVVRKGESVERIRLVYDWLEEKK
ncbi:hypothetical protein BCR34DRAFT_509013 [Clohesyomyces aquaticus]|uniref:Uncharacterized protein n=1 Tax=Clohesyomyces aquaticus TaxID=1231657 RepID=A0A1Y1ZXR4_9PLEO|nr:hypothetical protein BCR34DRAFT_509013 [Clohesyomyces aquaticus]